MRARAAREAAKNAAVPAGERVAGLLRILEEELASPTPDVETFPPLLDSVSNAIQSNVMHGLAEVADMSALDSALQKSRENQGLRKRIAVAIGLMKAPADDPAQAAVVPELMRLVRWDSASVVRSQAARALGNVALSNPKLKHQVISVLRMAVRDPVWRIYRGCAGDHRPYKFYPVSSEAVGALLKLGVDRETIHEWASEQAGEQRVRWTSVRDVLAGQGYALIWDPAKRELAATRGAEVIRLQVGSEVARVDGREIRMDEAPRIVDGRVQILASFAEALR